MATRWPITSIIMAKLPEAGAVKTRLIEDGYESERAAEVARAMLQCITARLLRRGAVVLGVSPDGSGRRVQAALNVTGERPIPSIDQGSGDLGRRMTRVWEAAAPDRPAAFFGNDSPDVPEALLDEIPAALRSADAAIGPTDDGGIWTLAARQPRPALLASIDWGTDRVYDQIRKRAEEAGVTLVSLSGWYDIDRAEDVSAMVRRLGAIEAGGACVDPALPTLRGAIVRLISTNEL